EHDWTEHFVALKKMMIMKYHRVIENWRSLFQTEYSNVNVNDYLKLQDLRILEGLANHEHVEDELTLLRNGVQRYEEIVSVIGTRSRLVTLCPHHIWFQEPLIGIGF